MIHHYRRSLSCILILLLSVASFRTVSANSAQSYWEGTDASGQIITEGDSPLQIESEDLTFEIHQFPESSIGTSSELSEYQDHVVAEYRLSNPSEYTVTARLFFPYGHVPSYIHIQDENGDPLFFPDSSSHEVTVDGQSIEYTLRHSYSHYFEKFEVGRDLGRLHEEIVDHDFFRQDLPVHFYTLKPEEELCDGAELSVDMDLADRSRIYYFKDLCSLSGYEDHYTAMMNTDPEDGLYHITVFGEPLSEQSVFEIYDCSDTARNHPLQISVGLAEHRVSTLKEELMKIRPENLGISETDWINAGFDFLKDTASDMPLLAEIGVNTDLGHMLMRWMEYEITLEPGQTITNTVKAPLYPSIDRGYDPEVYEYTYLISPVTTWAFTGPIRVHLNTEFELVDNNEKFWTQTGKGYMKSLEDLPDEELIFTLSTASHPVRKSFVNDLVRDPLEILSHSGLVFSLLFILLLPILLLILLYVVIHRWIRNKK